MHKEEFPQESELPYRHIGASGCLKPFHAADANANMGGLDHGHVVRAIANGKENGLEVPLDELDNQCLLQWRHATGYVSRAPVSYMSRERTSR